MSIDETPLGEHCSPSLSAAEVAAMTVAQIEVLAARFAADEAAWALLEGDGRAGVRRLAIRHRRRLQRQEQERQRQERLLRFERRFWGQGMARVAGVDEVGRGCLAGPVVAAAVVLPPEVDLPGLDDSKKLSPEKRAVLCQQIEECALAVGVGQVEAGDIDRSNILQASLQAMRLALEALGLQPEQVLVDGNRAPGTPFPETCIVDGDALSLSIAAASVVAKVHRDRLMEKCDAEHPGYGFASHKGYGSAEHLEALRLKGPCPLHRRSFAPVAELLEKERSPTFATFREGLESCLSRAELERMGELVRRAAGSLSGEELEALRKIYRGQARRLEERGRKGEAEAARFLQERGYQVLERGWRGAGGEIDLVARKDGELVFVEVKTSGALDAPEARVDAAKKRHLARAARAYLQHLGGRAPACRFDVVAVFVGEGKPRVEHIENAFEVAS